LKHAKTKDFRRNFKNLVFLNPPIPRTHHTANSRDLLQLRLGPRILALRFQSPDGFDHLR
jgi:hypothetical protein